MGGTGWVVGGTGWLSVRWETSKEGRHRRDQLRRNINEHEINIDSSGYINHRCNYASLAYMILQMMCMIMEHNNELIDYNV